MKKYKRYFWFLTEMEVFEKRFAVYNQTEQIIEDVFDSKEGAKFYIEKLKKMNDESEWKIIYMSDDKINSLINILREFIDNEGSNGFYNNSEDNHGKV